MNVSATFNVLRLVTRPDLCLPHMAVPTFNHLPVPITLEGHNTTIKAIVLDKDNCFAKDLDDKVWPEYQEKWDQLRAQYPGDRMIIVSNSAGTNVDIDHKQAQTLEERTGVKVLRHTTKKPGCHEEIMAFFKEKDVAHSPSEVAIIGDRLFTDVLMANMMGAYAIWLHQGVVESNSYICQIERKAYSQLKDRWKPQDPSA